MKEFEWKRVRRKNYDSLTEEIASFKRKSPEALLCSCGFLYIWDDDYHEYISSPSGNNSIQEHLDARSNSIVGSFYAC